jgi:hypothetical protein
VGFAAMKKQLERLVAALEARPVAQAPRPVRTVTLHEVATARCRMWRAIGRSSLNHPAVDAGVEVAKAYLAKDAHTAEETSECNARLRGLWLTLISETSSWHQWERELAWASGRI